MPEQSAIALVHHPLDTITPAFPAGLGAEVQFLGVVRGIEDGQPITGITYTAYEPMAQAMLQALHRTALEQHPAHHLTLHHRLGHVPANEASILIRVRTKHSTEAFELCAWYLQQVKKTVPIWKEFC